MLSSLELTRCVRSQDRTQVSLLNQREGLFCPLATRQHSRPWPHGGAHPPPETSPPPRPSGWRGGPGAGWAAPCGPSRSPPLRPPHAPWPVHMRTSTPGENFYGNLFEPKRGSTWKQARNRLRGMLQRITVCRFFHASETKEGTLRNVLGGGSEQGAAGARGGQGRVRPRSLY